MVKELRADESNSASVEVKNVTESLEFEPDDVTGVVEVEPAAITESEDDIVGGAV